MGGKRKSGAGVALGNFCVGRRRSREFLIDALVDLSCPIAASPPWL